MAKRNLKKLLGSKRLTRKVLMRRNMLLHPMFRPVYQGEEYDDINELSQETTRRYYNKRHDIRSAHFMAAVKAFLRNDQKMADFHTDRAKRATRGLERAKRLEQKRKIQELYYKKDDLQEFTPLAGLVAKGAASVGRIANSGMGRALGNSAGRGLANKSSENTKNRRPWSMRSRDPV